RAAGAAQTPSGRAVMGRKGIGKLSLFSIAGNVEIYTAKDGQASALRMTVADIEEAIKANKPYFPVPIEFPPDVPQNGTTIVLSEVKKSLHLTAAALRKRIARRFSIIGPSNNFRVFIT